VICENHQSLVDWDVPLFVCLEICFRGVRESVGGRTISISRLYESLFICHYSIFLKSGLSFCNGLYILTYSMNQRYEPVTKIELKRHMNQHPRTGQEIFSYSTHGSRRHFHPPHNMHPVTFCEFLKSKETLQCEPSVFCIFHSDEGGCVRYYSRTP